MFSAISVIATLTRSGNAVAPTGWIWLLFTAVPLLSEFFGGTPDTYHTAGLERGDRQLKFYETRDNLRV